MSCALLYSAHLVSPRSFLSKNIHQYLVAIPYQMPSRSVCMAIANIVLLGLTLTHLQYEVILLSKGWLQKTLVYMCIE